MLKAVDKEHEDHSTLLYYKHVFTNKYILRMQSVSFLICINKETGDYENIYCEDSKEGRKYLKEIAEAMDKHESLL